MKAHTNTYRALHDSYPQKTGNQLFKLYRFRALTKQVRLLALLVVILALCSWLIKPSAYRQERELSNNSIDSIFQRQLEDAIACVTELNKLCDEKASVKKIRNHFRKTRLAYKKAAVLIDYFHPAESIQLNAAALPRAEVDNPGKVLDPHGFQVLEEMIFGNPKQIDFEKINEETLLIKNILLQLLRQPNRHYKFKNELVADALRTALIRMTALGITGFDSPLAKHSIPEAISTLESTEELLKTLFREHPFSFDQNGLFTQRWEDAIRYLETNRNFNKMNRLEFICDHVLPCYETLARLSYETGFTMPKEKRPINAGVSNFMSAEVFDMSFFSPGPLYEASGYRIDLGKKLFHDPILSSSQKRSCASCHKPELAFTDGLKTAIAIDNKTYLRRNTPTLWNSALQTRQFFDSRVSLLEHQLNAVVHNEQEMDGSLDQAVVKLNSNEVYRELFKKAYSNEQDAISNYTIANAISSYIRSLVAMNAKFDQYIAGDKTKLDAQEIKGFNLFMGKAKCGTCHFIPLFNGLLPPEFTDTESEVIAAPAKNDKEKPELDPDEGKFLYTRSPVHRYAFKTPTLRNIALTAPYMHNGVFGTLEEVMDFYNKGGGSGWRIAPPNQTLPPTELHLSKKEVKAIISFMHALTDSAVVSYQALTVSSPSLKQPQKQ